MRRQLHTSRRDELFAGMFGRSSLNNDHRFVTNVGASENGSERERERGREEEETNAKREGESERDGHTSLSR